MRRDSGSTCHLHHTDAGHPVLNAQRQRRSGTERANGWAGVGRGTRRGSRAACRSEWCVVTGSVVHHGLEKRGRSRENVQRSRENRHDGLSWGGGAGGEDSVCVREKACMGLCVSVHGCACTRGPRVQASAPPPLFGVTSGAGPGPRGSRRGGRTKAQAPPPAPLAPSLAPPRGLGCPHRGPDSLLRHPHSVASFPAPCPDPLSFFKYLKTHL